MFQNISNEPLHLKCGQILGRASCEAGSIIYETYIQIDWSDLVQPGPRRRSMGPQTPQFVSSTFYMALVPAERQSLADELDFLAANVFYIEKDNEPPSETLRFTKLGKEIQRPPRSIREDKLWNKIASVQQRQIGEMGNLEFKEEIPPFAPIPDRLPHYPNENISRSDIRMGGDLSQEQQNKLFALIMENIKVFGKGGRIGQVQGYKATIDTEGKIPLP